jgi:hypothetical protein
VLAGALAFVAVGHGFRRVSKVTTVISPTGISLDGKGSFSWYGVPLLETDDLRSFDQTCQLIAAAILAVASLLCGGGAFLGVGTTLGARLPVGAYGDRLRLAVERRPSPGRSRERVAGAPERPVYRSGRERGGRGR